MEYGVKHFKYNDGNLTEDDKLVLEHLSKAGEVINKIWKKQVDPKTGVDTFYAKGLTKEKVLELEKTSVPHILSPYTVKCLSQRSQSDFSMVPKLGSKGPVQ